MERSQAAIGKPSHPLLRAVCSPYLFMSSATLFWASNVLLVRAIHEQITPISLNFWRSSTQKLF